MTVDVYGLLLMIVGGCWCLWCVLMTFDDNWCLLMSIDDFVYRWLQHLRHRFYYCWYGLLLGLPPWLVICPAPERCLSQCWNFLPWYPCSVAKVEVQSVMPWRTHSFLKSNFCLSVMYLNFWKESCAGAPIAFHPSPGLLRGAERRSILQYPHWFEGWFNIDPTAWCNARVCFNTSPFCGYAALS